VPLKTEETFQVQAPPDRVWQYLVDPRQVVTCLPGAELTSVQDESTFLGRVKVKVGPVLAAYTGKVVITERDDAARVIRMIGEGRENTGGGSAKVVITSTVTVLGTGGTEVRVTAELDVVGRIAQFGRGMIESVNRHVFRQFTECVRAKLEAPAEVAGAPAPPRATEGGPPLPASPAVAPLVARDARGPQTSTVETVQPVRLLPLIGRVLWDWLARLVGRRPKLPR
jgi:carbon monoxide dehydrogenase subunit G